MSHSSIWLVGAGNMGGAILDGWLRSGIDRDRLTVIDRAPADVGRGIRALATSPAGENPDILVLAVKPQQLAELVATMPGMRPRLLLSILAGVEIATLQRLFDGSRVVRAMPNLPVAIGQGVVALHAGPDVGAEGRAEAEGLLRTLGHLEWIADEASFDAVTALSGCGPAFLFRFVDALAEAGAALGLPGDQALRLALATVEGSAAMAVRSGVPPRTLADRVASPGGSTREGLNVLDRDGALSALLRETLAASAARNRALAAAARISP